MPARELVESQRATIAALEELGWVRQAYTTNEQARAQALQMAKLLFGMLGQAQERVAELKRRLDALTVTVPQPPEVDRARAQEGDLRRQLLRAEAERDQAQRVADLAARRIHELEAQLRSGPSASSSASSAALVMPDVVEPEGTEAFDAVDQVLEKAREVLDFQHEAVQTVADDLGWCRELTRQADKVVVVVQEGTVLAHPPGGLSEVVPYNLPGDGIAPAHTTYLHSATGQISRGVDLDEIALRLCRPTLHVFADEILVYLREPLATSPSSPRSACVGAQARTDMSEGGHRSVKYV